MHVDHFTQFGSFPALVRVLSRTLTKIGKTGRPEEWKNVDIYRVQLVRLILNFETSTIGAMYPDRFKMPAWAEKVLDTTLIRHPEKGTNYVHAVGDGIEGKTRYFLSTGEEITEDPRLAKLLPSGAPKPHSGPVSFVLSTENILTLERL